MKLLEEDAHMKKIVIWGLKTDWHSHRYIHEGFYLAASRRSSEVIWLDDLAENNDFVNAGDLVITVNVSSKSLKPNESAHFVLHNVTNSDLLNQRHVTNLQVYTHEASGVSLHGTTCLWDEASGTLYQPWGIPSTPDEWVQDSAAANIEYWIGSIWNNSQGQGNDSQIAEYRAALRRYGVKFRQVGGVGITLPRVLGGRTLRRNSQVSDAEARHLVSRSPVGASIVGTWQKTAGYVPCRTFKNLAAGQPVSSNANFSNIFSESVIYHDSIGAVVDERLSLSPARKAALIRHQQNQMEAYTYDAALERILQVLR